MLIFLTLILTEVLLNSMTGNFSIYSLILVLSKNILTYSSTDLILLLKKASMQHLSWYLQVSKQQQSGWILRKHKCRSISKFGSRSSLEKKWLTILLYSVWLSILKDGKPLTQQIMIMAINTRRYLIFPHLLFLKSLACTYKNTIK